MFISATTVASWICVGVLTQLRLRRSLYYLLRMNPAGERLNQTRVDVCVICFYVVYSAQLTAEP